MSAHLPQPGNAFVTLRNDSMAVMVAETHIRAGEEVGSAANSRVFGRS